MTKPKFEPCASLIQGYNDTATCHILPELFILSCLVYFVTKMDCRMSNGGIALSNEILMFSITKLYYSNCSTEGKRGNMKTAQSMRRDEDQRPPDFDNPCCTPVLSNVPALDESIRGARSCE